MATERLDADLQGTPTNQTNYRRMIGGLMYLTASRLDIAYATFVCARYQARPTVKHLKEVKRIFRYLRQSYNMGLWYPKDSEFELIAYSDVDHAGCKDDCKSTSGGLQFLGEKLVSWSSKKQDCIAMSTAEVEYVSLSACFDSKSANASHAIPASIQRQSDLDIRNILLRNMRERVTVELYFVEQNTNLWINLHKALPNDPLIDLVHRIVIIMAQQQHAADVHPDELCPPNKRYDLMDANKKIDFEQEDGSKYRLTFMLDKKELSLTLDDFKTIFHLPQATNNNHDSFVPPPSFLDMVTFYKNELGFTIEMKTSSSFKTTDLLQPWQTLCKIFSKCLTTCVTRWDQPPLQIMQMIYCFINNIHVDYVELLWEGLHYSLHHPTSLIPYPRFTKIIISHYMTNFPEISRKIQRQSWNEDSSLDDLKRNEAHEALSDVCGAPMPTVDKADEMILQDTLQVSLAEHKSREEQEARENVELVNEHLASVEIEKMVLEPRIDKESPEVEITNDKELEITNVVIPVNVNEEEYLFEHLRAKFLSKKSFDTLADHLQEVMVESLPTMVDKHIKEQVEKQVPEQVPQDSLVKLLSSPQEDQDDPHDDAHTERENSAKRQNTSEYKAHVIGESSGQVNEKEQGQSSLRNQEKTDDYDFWTEYYALEWMMKD
ncbi:hypothetical protein Tco_1353379 [Tanacetum coccineum]